MSEYDAIVALEAALIRLEEAHYTSADGDDAQLRYIAAVAEHEGAQATLNVILDREKAAIA